MKSLFFALMLASTVSVAQSTGDKKIILVTDSDSLYQKIKYAFGKANFMVKDDGNRDTIRTFPADLSGIPGYAVLSAVIKGNTVELSGFYGLTRMDDFGYTRTPKNYKPILYFKGSKAWKRLNEVADKIGYTTVTYTK